MISVIIPLYNMADCIARTLASVTAQTFADYEIVVVDDGSTDGGAELVEGLGIPRLRLVRQRNAGVSTARNRGVEEARGEFVAFLDADDEWKRGHLENLASLVEKYPECSVFATDYEFRYGDGQVSNPVIRRLPFSGEDGELTNYFEVASCSHPPLWTSAVMAGRAALRSVGGFPVGVGSGEDLLTWARLAVRYRIAFSRRTTAVFNVQPADSDASKPKSRFSERDFVLEGLCELERNAGDDKLKHDLHKYVLRWYKIQCVIMLEIGLGRKCSQNALRALLNGGRVTVFVPLVLLGLLPKKLSLKIIGLK